MRALVLLCLPLILSPALGASDLQIRAAEITGYGIFEAASSQRQTGFSARAPAADAVKGVRFVEFTNTIPAALGTNFGFQYIINSSPRGAEMNVTNIIRFPGEGLKRPGGRSWTESRENRKIRIGHRDFYGYAFDEPWEMVPGEWVFEVWHNNARLIRKTFTVVPTESQTAPDR
ncbi:MAG: DUF3859 domain-containing protein [Pseudomonadota bacterium]